MNNTVKIGDILVGKYNPNFYEVVEISGNTVSLRKLDRTVRMTMLDYVDTTYYEPIKGKYADDEVYIRELGKSSLKLWDGKTIVEEYRYTD